ncbi:MAG: hypothetical protein HQL29_06275 [Candidatus Omnitrophica bacterium]|nr:hypothetical protein [Candidatus Omnitrophota bacterium]
MHKGILNPAEAESIPIIKMIIQYLLWEPRKKNEVCCFSVPADPIDREQDTIYHRGVIESILKETGFTPLIIDEAYAVVLSEMEDVDFTGIGVSCGGGMVNVCLAFKSVPVMSFSITRGGDWIDQSAASALNMAVTRVTTIKERGIDLKKPQGREAEAIAIFYRNYIRYFLEKMSQVFGQSSDKPDFADPVDIVFAGGSSLVEGFIDVVKEEAKTINLGIPVGKIRRANEPFTSVARGCLFNAINTSEG